MPDGEHVLVVERPGKAAVRTEPPIGHWQLPGPHHRQRAVRWKGAELLQRHQTLPGGVLG